MTSCAVNTTIPAAQVSYIDGKCTVSKRVPKYRLAPKEVTGYPLYSGEDKTGFYLVKAKEATNHVTNPTFYNDIVGWTSSNADFLRTNEWSFSDGFSARITGTGDTSDPVARAYIESEAFGFVPGLSYTFSAYLWQQEIYEALDSDFDLLAGTISIIQQERDDLGNVLGETELVSERLSKIQRWQRIAISATIALTTTNILVRVNLRGDSTKRYLYSPYDEILNGNGDAIYNDSSEYIYADMLQFEQGNEATTPFHGSTSSCASPTNDCGGYSWLGFPHQSASHRSECARDGGVLVSLTDLGFEILSHASHDGMAVNNVAQPYSNRPGSNYQKSVLGPSRTLTFTGYTCNCGSGDCELYNLQNYIMPQIQGCGQKFLLVYHHDPDYCSVGCQTERDLAMCVVYRSGFEYAKTNHHQQKIVLQLEAHDPLAWFSWPGHNSIGLNFVEAIRGNRVIKVGKDGEYTTYPIDTGKDIRAIGCLPGTNSFVLGGEFEGINAQDDNENLTLYDCVESCTIEGGMSTGAVNVIEATSTGHVIIGGAFMGNLAIIYGDNQLQGFFDGYPGGEVWAIDKPFWGEVAVGTDSSIAIQLTNGSWLTFTTNGRVNDLQSDKLGNIYATGEFTEIDGTTYGRVARFNVNKTGCLDVENGTWESIGYSFDDTMNAIALNEVTNTLCFGGLANNATPDLVTICNEVTGTSRDSKGRGNVCTSHFEGTGFDWVDGSNPQRVFSFQSGGVVRCDMWFQLSSDGVITDTTNPVTPPINMAGAGNLITLSFQFPVENIVLSLDGVDSSEILEGFNQKPDTVTGDFVQSNNRVFSAIDGGAGTLEWDGPISEITIGYSSDGTIGTGTFDDEIGLVHLAFDAVSNGNNQQFSFEDIGGGQTRFEVAMSNPIAQLFLDDCLNSQPVTANQRRYARITASNSQGIDYNFLVGEDNLTTSLLAEEGGMYIVRMDVDTNAVFPPPCDELNTPFSEEFYQSNSDLALYDDLTLSGGPGIDNLLSTIKITCVTLDVYFQGDDLAINHIACLEGQNLTALGNGIDTEVYDLEINPLTGELWAGYEGGLSIWNGQDWFDYPASLSGSVIDMSFCSNGDILLLTDEDGNHIMPGITDINYYGNFEQLMSQIRVHGPGTLEYILEACTGKQARFCAAIECGDIATLNMSNGDLAGTRDLNATVLSGSRLDFWLRKCGQNLNMFVSNDGPTTKATLVYNEHFWGINSACCSGRGSGTGGGYLPSPIGADALDCCENNNLYLRHRDPEVGDCSQEGWATGDLWLNLGGDCGLPRFFVNTADDCTNDCEENLGLISGGNILLSDTDENYCPPEPS